MAVFIPTKRPAESKRGPPEFPVPGSEGGWTLNAVRGQFYCSRQNDSKKLDGGPVPPRRVYAGRSGWPATRLKSLFHALFLLCQCLNVFKRTQGKHDGLSPPRPPPTVDAIPLSHPTKPE
jgi:hypothetical protein